MVFWDVTWHRFVAGYQHFGTTYLCQLQGSSSPRRTDPWRWDQQLTQNVGNQLPTYSCNIPEEQGPQLHHIGRLNLVY